MEALGQVVSEELAALLAAQTGLTRENCVLLMQAYQDTRNLKKCPTTRLVVVGGGEILLLNWCGGVSVLPCNLNFYFPQINFDQKIQWKTELNSNITDISKF